MIDVDLKTVYVVTEANPVSGDLFIGSDGDVEEIDGTEAEKQAQIAGLKTFLGEWFVDINEGVPYLKYILGVRGPNKKLIEETLTKELLRRGTVSEVNHFVIELGQTTRISWQATLKNGGTVTAETSVP